MPSLKGLLFSQLAAEGLNNLLEEMQAKYKPKRGRRFNHNNITYEISRPTLKDCHIEFEISSKIPEDELDNPKDMKTYFQEIKKILSKGDLKPSSIEMENIVWDSKKETEKTRDYVKLAYQVPLDDLFDTGEVINKFEEINQGKTKEAIPEIASAFTPQGKLVLHMVRQNIQAIGRRHIDELIAANKQVRAVITH
ncbi:MAG: hypothetical protein ACE5E9_01685 [Nitrospinaceae bacterium]